MIQAALQAFFGDEFEAISFSEELLQQNLKNVEANKKDRHRFKNWKKLGDKSVLFQGLVEAILICR